MTPKKAFAVSYVLFLLAAFLALTPGWTFEWLHGSTDWSKREGLAPRAAAQIGVYAWHYLAAGVASLAGIVLQVVGFMRLRECPPGGGRHDARTATSSD